MLSVEYAFTPIQYISRSNTGVDNNDNDNYNNNNNNNIDNNNNNNTIDKEYLYKRATSKLRKNIDIDDDNDNNNNNNKDDVGNDNRVKSLILNGNNPNLKNNRLLAKKYLKQKDLEKRMEIKSHIHLMETLTDEYYQELTWVSKLRSSSRSTTSKQSSSSSLASSSPLRPTPFTFAATPPISSLLLSTVGKGGKVGEEGETTISDTIIINITDQLQGIRRSDPKQNPLLLAKPHIFIHIPKTGGTSLIHLFKQNVDESKLYHTYTHPYPVVEKLVNLTVEHTIFGHFFYGLHLYYQDHFNEYDIPSNNRHFYSHGDSYDHLTRYSYMTMLRDPVDRVISHYYFLLDSVDHPLHRETKSMDLMEWVEKNAIADNEQTRRILGLSRELPFDHMSLSIALHHLQYSIKFVGIMERYDESIVLLSYYAGFDELPKIQTNIGRSKQRVSVSDQIKKKIMERNYMDIALYEMALTIFEEEIDLVGRELVEQQVELYRRQENHLSMP